MAGRGSGSVGVAVEILRHDAMTEAVMLRFRSGLMSSVWGKIEKLKLKRAWREWERRRQRVGVASTCLT